MLQRLCRARAALRRLRKVALRGAAHSSQFNSVHKRPNSAPGGSCHPFVYTITVTRGRPRHDSVHKRPNLASGGSYLPSVYTIVATGPPATQQCTQTPQTGAERPLPPICVHYRGPPEPPAAQQCIQMHLRYSRRVIASSVRRLTSAAPRRTPRSCRTGWRPSRPRRRGRCAPRPERSPAPCSGCGRFPSSCWQTRPR